jgi:6,7-dimethyl-8-ribityllumazine synthase
MATKNKNLSDYDPSVIPDAADMKFGIVVSEWNQEVTFALRDGCVEAMQKHKATEDNIEVVYVPGTFELPVGARMLLSSGDYDAVICIGCVIKGETKHDEYINTAVAQGLVNLGMTSNKPVIFGVLTPNNMEQALDRAGGKHGNKGVEAAVTAIKMVHLKRSLKGSKKPIGY